MSLFSLLEPWAIVTVSGLFFLSRAIFSGVAADWRRLLGSSLLTFALAQGVAVVYLVYGLSILSLAEELGPLLSYVLITSLYGILVLIGGLIQFRIQQPPEGRGEKEVPLSLSPAGAEFFY